MSAGATARSRQADPVQWPRPDDDPAGSAAERAARRSLARTRPAQAILSAADDCLRELGLRTSITDIANAAGVSRPTVYRYFADRDQILLELGLRSVENFMQYALREVRDLPSPRKRLVMAVCLLTQGRPQGSRLATFRDDQVRRAVYELVSRSPAYYDLVRGYLEPLLHDIPELDLRARPQTVDEVIELVVRLVLSVPLLSGALTRPESSYEFIDRYLAGAVYAESGDGST